MVKIKDIAERCGVSIATVSKALSGNSDLNTETAARICETAKEMGYIPNANARILKTNRSYNIGILFVDQTCSGLTHEYFSAILNSLKTEAEANGFDITFITNRVGNGIFSFLQHAKYRNVDGVIIASVDFKDPGVIELVESEIPTITIDYQYNNKSAIISNNVKGIETIVNYVSECGHNRIAFIHGENTDVTKYRLASFYKTIDKLGLSIPDEYIIEAKYHSPKDSGIATRTLLNLSVRPTCIIYPDDYSILGGITELEKHGLSIPDDISVVGYDGIALSRLLRPCLTTYVQDTDKIGKVAVDKLIEMITHPKSSIAESINVEGVLQKGGTVINIKG